MKKIFHFVSTNILSGLENVVINICTLIKGYDFIYVSPDGPINKYLNKYHIKHISIKRMTPLNVRYIIKKYKPNIVQGHDVKASLSLATNYCLCHRNNIKIISELHNDDPRMWRYGIRSILYMLSSYFYNNIIVISGAVLNNYIFNNIIKKKTTIIPNIVNIYRINDDKYTITTKWDCIFIGRLVNQKNPLEFVKIIYLLKSKMHFNNIKAVMLGAGELNNKIHYMIKSLGLSNNITLVGFQQNPYLYLKCSYICIIPSKFEGFGLVALESLLVGTPVIASPTGGLLNIVNKNCGGFARNSYEFAQFIYYLLRHKDILKKNSINSKLRAEKINDITSFIKRYSKIYNYK